MFQHPRLEQRLAMREADAGTRCVRVRGVGWDLDPGRLNTLGFRGFGDVPILEERLGHGKVWEGLGDRSVQLDKRLSGFREAERGAVKRREGGGVPG